MAQDMFLKLTDIEAESKDKVYGKNIDVLAWSWGCSQSATMHMGGGGGGYDDRDSGGGYDQGGGYGGGQSSGGGNQGGGNQGGGGARDLDDEIPF